MVELDQGAATDPEGESLVIFFMHDIGALVIIWVKDGNQR